MIGSVAGLALLVGLIYVAFQQLGGKPRRKSTPPGVDEDMEAGRVHPFISGAGMLSLTAQHTNDLDFVGAETEKNRNSDSSDLSVIYPNTGDNFAHNSPRGPTDDAAMSSVALRPVSVDSVGI